MPMNKNTSSAPQNTVGITTTAIDNGLDAAVNRLKGGDIKPASLPLSTPSKEQAETQNKAYKPRDFEEEARGKTRCLMYAHALGSMAIAGLKWSTQEELMQIIRKFADDGVKYSFGDKD